MRRNPWWWLVYAWKYVPLRIGVALLKPLWRALDEAGWDR